MSDLENKDMNQAQPAPEQPAVEQPAPAPSVPAPAVDPQPVPAAPAVPQQGSVEFHTPEPPAAAQPAPAPASEPAYTKPTPQLTLEPNPAAPSIAFPEPPKAPEPPAEPAAQPYGTYNYNNGQPQGYQPPQYTQNYNAGYQAPNYTAQSYQQSQPQPTPQYTEPPVGYQQRSRLAAGILAIMLGALGVHNFYLGFNTRGTIQLVLCLAGGLLTCGVGSVAALIWGFIEGVMLLSSNAPKFDGNNVILRD